MGWRFGTTNPGFRKTWSMTGNQDGAAVKPSGFGTDLLDFKIAAALAENNSQEIMVLIQTLTASHFQSFTRTGTDLGINENSTEAAGDNNLKIVNPTGEGADSHEANPTRERGKSDERLTTLSEDEMLELAEMELDALRDQEALHAQVKRLPAYLKAEVDELYYEFQRQLYPLAIRIKSMRCYSILTWVKSTACEVQQTITTFVGLIPRRGKFFNQISLIRDPLNSD
ncbi:hypothetical protein H4Q26_004035 [Puccinia striiformis f. sp. tritici PST-130]|nr:hypothetical protein H4Q26_004035 [Puccinia striiformis f. sp. tritici PST-130]